MARPSKWLPNACAASSTTRSRCLRAIAYRRSRSTGKTRQIDRQQRTRGRRNGRLNTIQIDVAGDRIDIDKTWPRAYGQDHVARRHPRQRRRDDFMPGTHTGNTQTDLHGAGT